jgi:hypothetical protein
MRARGGWAPIARSRSHPMNATLCARFPPQGLTTTHRLTALVQAAARQNLLGEVDWSGVAHESMTLVNEQG